MLLPTLQSLQPENESVQVLWDAPLFKAKYNDLLEKQVLPAERARLRAVASEHSSDWLNAIPIAKIGLKLDRAGIRIACRLRLGAPLGLPHRCPCGEMVTELGRHGISCKYAKGRHSRHDTINELIQRALVSAQIPARREKRGLISSNDKRPDGVTMVPWSEGKPVAWDYSTTQHVTLWHQAI